MLFCGETALRRKGTRWLLHSVAWKRWTSCKMLFETHLASWLVCCRLLERVTSLEASSMSPGSENLEFVLCKVEHLFPLKLDVNMLTTFGWSWCAAVGTLQRQKVPGPWQSPTWGRPRTQSRGCRRPAGRRCPGASHRGAPCEPQQDLLHLAEHLPGSSGWGQPSCRLTCWCKPQIWRRKKVCLYN